MLVAILEIVILKSADRRCSRALAAAGPSQGFQPLPPGNPPTIALVSILEHKYHTWGQVLQGSRGECEVLLFDYSHSVFFYPETKGICPEEMQKKLHIA